MSCWNPEFEISVSDSEDEGVSYTKTFSGREAIIFIVDANLYNCSELLSSALVILRSSLLSGILVNDKDLIGIVFANTEYSPEPFEPHCLENINVPQKCAVFLPPRQLNTSIIQNFLSFVETAPSDFPKMYGVASNDNCNFSHILRLCIDLVQQCNYLVDNTKIVFLTDRELPHSKNSECYRQVLQKATDFRGKDIDFHVIPMIDEFNYDVFYKEFICLLQNIDIECFQPPDPKHERELLANRKFSQHYVRRSLGHFSFSLSPNLEISAQYFNYYQKHKRPKKVLLQRSDSAIVRKRRITQVHKHDFEIQTYKEAKDVNIKNAWYEINLGPNNMRLTYDQVNRVRNLHSPGMALLGFKPRSHLKCIINTKSSNFMYPDDIYVKGSKRLFRALWEKCIQKQKVAICLFMCKRKSMPRYIALVPITKDQNFNKQDSIVSNDCFKIVYLSCHSYIRNFNLCDWKSIASEVKDDELIACEKLMKKFRLDYKSEVVCDPDLDMLQSKLLSLAFNVNYETLGSQYFPNPVNQNSRLKSIVTRFEEIFGNEVVGSMKRCSDDVLQLSSDSKKKSKYVDVNNKDSVMEMVSNKKLNLCSKDQLFQILDIHLKKSIPKTTKKQDLLDIIYNFYMA